MTGGYDAYFKLTDLNYALSWGDIVNNYCGPVNFILYVTPATPIVNPEYTDPGSIFTKGSLPELRLGAGSTPGYIAWDEYAIFGGYWFYTWTFTPENTNHTKATGSIWFNGYISQVEELRVVTGPKKTAYTVFEPFEITGLVVEIVYSCGSVETLDLTDPWAYTLTYQSGASSFRAGETYITLKHENKSVQIPVTAAKAQVTKPVLTTAGFTYDGVAKTVSLNAAGAYTLGGDVTKTNAGAYTATVTLNDSANYEWIDGTTGVLQYNWSIAKVQITKPTAANTAFVYTGYEQSLGIAANAAYAVTGDKNTNAGNSYSATVVLNDKVNCEWADGTTNNLNISWSIAKARITKPVLSVTEFIYDGVAKTLSLNSIGAYTLGGDTAKISAGAYTAVVTLNDTANYEWTDGTTDAVQYDWNIGKAFSGAAEAPTAASKTNSSITINAVTAPADRIIEYAISKAGVAPETSWQGHLVFAGLDSGTEYYIFARIKADDNHLAGAAAFSVASTVAKPNKIKDDSDSSWSKDMTFGAKIACDGDFAKFIGVKVNGILISEENYTVISGSTIVTLNPEYLQTLPAGEHNIELVFTDGGVTTGLVISPAGGGSGSVVPQKDGVPWWAVLLIILNIILILAIAALAVYWFVFKKKDGGGSEQKNCKESDIKKASANGGE